MKHMTLAATSVTALFLLLTFGVPNASADVYQLSSDHCNGLNGIPNGTGCLATGDTSAGTVTVTGAGPNAVTITVDLNSGYKFVSTGFNADFGFNLAGDPSITFSLPTGSGFAAGSSTGSKFTAQNPETAGTLHMDGTGNFEYGLVCTVCGSGASNALAGPLTFTITGTGLSTASFEQNSLGQYFAVDLIGLTNNQTGAVDASTKSSVPDGGMTLALLGGALVGIESLRRRFRV